MRNPLGDPYLLGISTGASLGAVAAIVLGAGAGGALGLGLSAAAFAGALAAFALVWCMARRGGGFSPLRLVLAGVGIGQFLSGFTSYLVLQAGDEQQTRSVLFWLMGQPERRHLEHTLAARPRGRRRPVGPPGTGPRHERTDHGR